MKDLSESKPDISFFVPSSLGSDRIISSIWGSKMGISQTTVLPYYSTTEYLLLFIFTVITILCNVLKATFKTTSAVHTAHSNIMSCEFASILKLVKLQKQHHQSLWVVCTFVVYVVVATETSLARKSFGNSSFSMTFGTKKGRRRVDGLLLVVVV